jgi:hypothetical protein
MRDFEAVFERELVERDLKQDGGDATPVLPGNLHDRNSVPAASRYARVEDDGAPVRLARRTGSPDS